MNGNNFPLEIPLNNLPINLSSWESNFISIRYAQEVLSTYWELLKRETLI